MAGFQAFYIKVEFLEVLQNNGSQLNWKCEHVPTEIKTMKI